MRRKKTIVALLLLAAAAAALYRSYRAQFWKEGPPPAAEPAQRSDMTLPFDLPEVLEYEIGVNGVQAASLRLAFEEADGKGSDLLLVMYDLQPAAGVETLWSYRAEGRSWVRQETLEPVRSERISVKKGSTKSKTVTVNRAAGEISVVKTAEDRDEPKKRTYPYNGEPNMASSLLMLRALPFRPGESISLTVMDGEDRYSVTATPKAPEPFESPAGMFSAIEVALHMREIEEGEEEEPYRRVRLWLSEEGRVPLKLQADIMFGSLYAELTGRNVDATAVNRAEPSEPDQ